MKNLNLLEKVRVALRALAFKDINRIAVEVGCSPQTVRNIRDCKGDPTFGNVQGIAERLGVVEAPARRERRSKSEPATA